MTWVEQVEAGVQLSADTALVERQRAAERHAGLKVAFAAMHDVLHAMTEFINANKRPGIRGREQLQELNLASNALMAQGDRASTLMQVAAQETTVALCRDACLGFQESARRIFSGQDQGDLFERWLRLQAHLRVLTTRQIAD